MVTVIARHKRRPSARPLPTADNNTCAAASAQCNYRTIPNLRSSQSLLMISVKKLVHLQFITAKRHIEKQQKIINSVSLVKTVQVIRY